MGTNKIEGPKRLAEKLRRISAYENGDRLPTPMAALAYAKLVNVLVDLLIDDERDLPKRLLK